MTLIAALTGLLAAISYGAIRCRRVYVNQLEREPWPAESDGIDLRPEWVNDSPPPVKVILLQDLVDAINFDLWKHEMGNR